MCGAAGYICIAKMFVFHLTNDRQIQRPLLPKAAEAEAEAASTAAIQLIDTEGGYMIRKWPAKPQHPKTTFFVTAGAYLFATNISDFFDLCLHWVSVVRAHWCI